MLSCFSDLTPSLKFWPASYPCVLPKCSPSSRPQPSFPITFRLIVHSARMTANSPFPRRPQVYTSFTSRLAGLLVGNRLTKSPMRKNKSFWVGIYEFLPLVRLNQLPCVIRDAAPLALIWPVAFYNQKGPFSPPLVDFQAFLIPPHPDAITATLCRFDKESGSFFMF